MAVDGLVVEFQKFNKNARHLKRLQKETLQSIEDVDVSGNIPAGNKCCSEKHSASMITSTSEASDIKPSTVKKDWFIGSAIGLD
ncbi:hypothetical protein SK128_020486 [Halocaridina rubra]|uniref:Uncharacterized protein n=1 Tax=Halocaridina rubra TaxID=373956 RepID=A0AAN8XGG3_HALRR